MTFKHIGFHESEVMRELERRAVKKGHFDLTPEEAVEAAAARVEKKAVSMEPTDDLKQDILKLASALRKQGYEQEASDIEKNFLFFKTAEVHLYHVHDEEGKDLLEFAHPEGEGKITDSEYGKVETTLSGHQKMLDIVYKEPKGKLAEAAALIKDSCVEEIADAIKKSFGQALTVHEQRIKDDQVTIGAYFENLKSYLLQLRNNVQSSGLSEKNYKFIANSIDGINTKLAVTITLDRTGYDDAIKKINESVTTLKNTLSSVQPATSEESVITLLLPSHSESYAAYALRVATEISKMIPGIAGKDIFEKDVLIKKEIVQQAKVLYSEALQDWSDMLTVYLDAGMDSDAEKASNNNKNSALIVRTLDAALSNKNVTLLMLIRALKGVVTFENENELLRKAQDWARITKRIKSAEPAEAIVMLKKTADVQLEMPSSKPPAAVSRPKIIAPGVPPAKQVYPGEMRPIKDEQQKVSLMQNIMIDFANNVVLNADNIAGMIKRSPVEVRNIAAKIGDTGVRTGPKADGKWGNNTINGLKNMNVILLSTGKNTAVNPGTNFRNTSAEDVIAAADRNSVEITKNMQELGFAIEHAPPGKIKEDFQAIDYLYSQLNEENIESSVQGEKMLTKSDLMSLADFWDFVTSSRIVTQIAEKPAAQAPEENTVLTSVKTDLVKSSQIINDTDLIGVPYSEFYNALNWVFKRARFMYNKTKNAEYYNLVKSLVGDWNKVWKRFQEAGTITRDGLTTVSTTGKIKGPGEGEDIDISRRRSALAARPFGRRMAIKTLFDQYRGWNDGNIDLNWYLDPNNVKSSTVRALDRQVISQSREEGLRSLVTDDRNPEVYLPKVKTFLNKLKADLNTAYSIWHDKAELEIEELDDVRFAKVRDDQNDEYVEWQRSISRALSRI